MQTPPAAPAVPETASGGGDGAPPMAASDPFIGRELAGKYRVMRRLGAGGMGAVYQALHLTTGGDVALKFLHGTAIGDENAVRRFQLEAQNVAALRHANTVRVIDFGVDQGTLYLVMEYLAGHPLSDVLLRDGPMPWLRAVHVLRQILKSLWEAHEHPKHIIHRDIKPANLFLVDLPGDKDHVRVVDFGIARALDGSGAGTQGLLGTPFYMAPELWRGETVDARTDLYALGCVAYQCLAGSPPFVPPPSASDSLYPLLNMHLNEPPPSLRQARPSVPGPIAEWVERMLAKEPGQRPASARIALEMLDAAARASNDPTLAAQWVDPAAPALAPSSPPATARTASAAPRPGAGRGLAPWLIVVIVLGAVGLLAGLIAVLSTGARSPDPMPDPTAAPNTPLAEGVASAPAHPTYGALVRAYRTRLSTADHLDEDGASLDDAAAVVTLDRIRYHAGFGDPEDGADDTFGVEAAQVQLYQSVHRSIDEATRRAILDGRPLVDIAIYERGLTVRLVPE